MHSIHRLALAALIVVGLGVPAVAQTTTQADIQRLQDNVYQAGNDITQLRGRDATRANQLQAELDDLRDEVIYLKVKLRKENTLGRGEYADVRNRIEDVRTRARGNGSDRFSTAPPSTGTQSGSTQSGGGTQSAGNRNTGARGGTREVPAGTEIDVRLSDSLNSGTSKVEDRFEGTTLADLVIDGRTLIPSGSIVRGVVTAVEPATRTNRTSKMTVSFDQVTVNNRAYPMRGTVTQAIEGPGIKGDATKAGIGAGAGAIIGGILGGVKGAIAGILIGGGGTIAATEGKEVDLAQGTVIRVRIDSPLEIGASANR